ncbi:hypothetical protein A3Q56_01876 [Intoshia linei]|uniref:BTB domain-containing protein n=1 Tax=Intoshia linei TaxID=1819745 RepID=A0A177B7S8_9BILA|nr:hypothetical protein A3Q56_01876 [Intoshia linei]
MSKMNMELIVIGRHSFQNIFLENKNGVFQAHIKFL